MKELLVCWAALVILASRAWADHRNPRSYGGGGGGTNAIPLGSDSGYQFEYSFADAGTGWVHSRDEWSDGEITRGSYDVLLPDGRIQRVTYTADDEGFKPVITYEIPKYSHSEYGLKNKESYGEKLDNIKPKKPIALPTEGFKHYTYTPKKSRPNYREKYLHNHLYDHITAKPYKHTSLNSYHLASNQLAKKTEEKNVISSDKEEDHPVKNMVKEYQSRYNYYNPRHPSPPPGYSPERPRSYTVSEGSSLSGKSVKSPRKPTNAHSKSYSKAVTVTEGSEELDISSEKSIELDSKETQVQKSTDHKIFEKDMRKASSTTESLFREDMNFRSKTYKITKISKDESLSEESSEEKLDSPFMKKMMTTMLPPDKPFSFTTYYTPKRTEILAYTTPLPFQSSDSSLRPTPRPAKIPHGHSTPIPSKSSATYIPVYATTPLPISHSTAISRHMEPPHVTPFTKRSYHLPATPVPYFSSLKDAPSRLFQHPAHPSHHLQSHHTYSRYPTESPPSYRDYTNEIIHFSQNYEPYHDHTSQYSHLPYQPYSTSSIHRSPKLPTHQFYPPRPLLKPVYRSSKKTGPSSSSLAKHSLEKES